MTPASDRASGASFDIRPAATADSEIVRAWRNDPLNYTWYQQARPVSAAEHSAWFAARVSEASPSLWILAVDDRAVGSVRLDRAANTASVSIVVDRAARGRGFGRELLAYAARAAAAEGIGTLVALVHPENNASLALFEAAGYRFSSVSADGFNELRLSIATEPA